MTKHKARAVLLSLVILLSMVGGGLAYSPPAEDLSSESLATDGQALDTEIDSELHEQSGTVDVIVKLDTPSASVSPAGDFSQLSQPLESFATQEPGVEIIQRFWIADALLLRVDNAETNIERLSRVDNVAALHDNAEVRSPEPVPVNSTVAPADQHADVTYGLDQINAPAVWEDFDTRGAGTKVAVLDTGIDPSHPDINLYTEDPDDPTYPGGWAEFDAEGTEIPSEPYDQSGHGTHVSGTVAGGDESGTAIGVAPEAELIHGGVLTPQGGTLASVLGGMQWAVEEDADVISMSLGADAYEPLFIDAVRNAEASGTVVVAAVGNSGEGTSGSPGNVYDSLSVGAANQEAQIADFSSGESITTDETWGAEAPADWPKEYIVPHVSGPGVGVVSAVPGGDYAAFSGTSMATPHVSGAIALMMSANERSPDQITQQLRETARKPDGVPPEKDTRYGDGIIDAYAATALEGDSATVSIPDRVTQSGDNVVVPIETDAANASGYETTITFDPSVVQVEAVTAGDLGEPVVNINNDAGIIRLTGAQATDTDAPTLANIEFTVVGEAEQQTSLTLDREETTVVDAAGETIYTATDDGRITVAENVATLTLSDETATAGSSTTVSLGADGDDIAGYVTGIEFDADVVQFTGATGVDMADPVANVDNEEGTVQLTAATADGTDSPTLAKLEFDVIGEEGTETALKFNDAATDVVDSNAESKAVAYEPGSVTVGEDDLPTGTTADISPDNKEVPINGTSTVDVVINNADNGIGAYEMELSVANADVVEISDMELTNDPLIEDVVINNQNSSVMVEVAMGENVHEPGNVTVATVTLEGVNDGSTELDFDSVNVADADDTQYTITDTDGSSLTATETRGPTEPIVGEDPPQDLDGDGLYEDVDGDGEMSIFDVQALYNNLDNDIIQQHPEAFNFAGDDDPGDVTIFDVQALFNSL